MKIKTKAIEEIGKTLNASGYHRKSGHPFKYDMLDYCDQYLDVKEITSEGHYLVKDNDRQYHWHPDWVEVIEE